MSKRYSDWNWIIPSRLAQGAYPGANPGLFQAFDVVVYMAKEAQPRLTAPAGKLVFHCPLNDDIYRPVPSEVGEHLHVLANQVAQRVSYGHKALITCVQGKNRSGLLTALTILKLYPSWTPEQAISIIRRNRKLTGGDIALANTMFEMYILANGRR